MAEKRLKHCIGDMTRGFGIGHGHFSGEVYNIDPVKIPNVVSSAKQ